MERPFVIDLDVMLAWAAPDGVEIVRRYAERSEDGDDHFQAAVREAALLYIRGLTFEVAAVSLPLSYPGRPQATARRP